MANTTMRAIVAYPKEPGRVEMIDVERPALPAGHVMIAMRDVGTDATDREVIAAEHGGSAPDGGDYLILGHESIGQIAEVGEGVTGLNVGDWVVATVRRPDGCPNCRRGESDMCLWGGYVERGIIGAHGYLTEYVIEKPEFLVTLPPHLSRVGALLEPISINVKAIGQAWSIQRRMLWEPKTALIFGLGSIGILAGMMLRQRGIAAYLYSRSPADSPKARLLRDVGITYIATSDVPDIAALGDHIGRIDFMLEATGAAPVAAKAMGIVQPNAVLCLLSVTGGSAREEVDIAAVNKHLVLGNGVIFGSVNSNAGHFREAVQVLDGFEKTWPGFAERLISRRVPLDRFREGLEDRDEDIKVLFEVSAAE
ncbi:MAG: glucose 1-dehydrogenase [Gemmatimonadaceae bacterium]